jgi:hypothetical protein
MADLSTNLTQITSTQAGKEITLNTLVDALSPSSIFGRRAVGSSLLVFAFFGGRLNVGVTPTLIANGSVTATASTTNYVEVNSALTVSVNTTGFTAGSLPLYTLTTNTTTITNYVDHRSAQGIARYFSNYGSVSKTITTADVTLTALEVLCSNIICSGTLTAARNLILPTTKLSWVITNNCTAFNLTAKTPSGSGVTLKPNSTTLVYSDGTNILTYSKDIYVNKAVVSNNATTAYTIPASTSYIAFIGTNTSTLAFTFPAGSETIDGLKITIVSQAAVTTPTFTSTGTTFIGNPSSLVANVPISFIYHHATTNWIIA